VTSHDPLPPSDFDILAMPDPSASFVGFLARYRPHLLPSPVIQGGYSATPGRIASNRAAIRDDVLADSAARMVVAEGTTVLALRYEGGVVLAGDRRATEGSFIAHRYIEKVHRTDSHSAVAVAGAAGPALEIVRLFQTELEHYEKVQGVRLSIAGQANRLASLVRSHFELALRGLVVVPVFGGYDEAAGVGRIFKYDLTGGRYEEREFHAEGSGGRLARSFIKQGFDPSMSRDAAVDLALEALYEAADEDAGTGGPDLARGIYPTIATVDSAGFARIADEEVADRFKRILQKSRE
jgi:proteasome beta subunit